MRKVWGVVAAVFALSAVTACGANTEDDPDAALVDSCRAPVIGQIIDGPGKLALSDTSVAPSAGEGLTIVSGKVNGRHSYRAPSGLTPFECVVNPDGDVIRVIVGEPGPDQVNRTIG